MKDKGSNASGKNSLKDKNTSESIRDMVNKNGKVLLGLFVLALVVIAFVYFLINSQSSRTSLKTGSSPSANVPTPASSSTSVIAPTLAPTPTPTLVPTPTPVPLAQGPQTYGISTRNIPQMYEVWFNTIDPKEGTQTVKLKVKDQSGKVSAVTATVKTNKLSKSYSLSLSDGTASDGTWTGSWTLNDTYSNNFEVAFSAADDKGNKSSVDLTIR